MNERDTSRRRLIAAIALMGALVVVTASGAAHTMAMEGISVLTTMLARHPIAAIALFVLLAGASSMLTFFSSTVLIPVALDAWGALATFVLLWVGWLLGGVGAYAVGRGVGGTLLGRLVPRRRIAHYERRLSVDTPIWIVLLLQLALPSEVPGYLLGTLRYSFFRYLFVVSVGELPYALGSVYLGESFLRGDPVMLTLGALAAVVLIGLAAMLLRRRFGISVVEGRKDDPTGARSR
ncbi:TVP38/TMEM64 family protein [Polyangium jinanense]|uniref:TVP38/TMEM64 family membrane protein n=1 Tax=Polyangium jinanense TaxID=2829994 RepID=A0A9X3XHU3_9BACT|nr:VTT domain-containing protein [Polyangium jinanense]MDC3988436.1 VTT domain-containing protein [Polyangium jinanense]